VSNKVTEQQKEPTKTNRKVCYKVLILVLLLHQLYG